jgi:hypothetical protein
MWEGWPVSRRRVTAFGCLAIAAALALLVFHAHQSDATAHPAESCGTYVEGGEFNGSENHRILISPDGVGCNRAAVVVRSFRSLLPKRHHGTGTASWWTLSSPSGWRCEKSASGGSCRDGQASVGFTVESTYPPRNCRNGITIGNGAAGVIILSWRNVSCGQRHALARGATHYSARHRGDHGFTCHRLNLRAGGGGALCHRGSRFIELGFE